jgi:GNAT superfamily N-acetyltransferase
VFFDSGTDSNSGKAVFSWWVVATIGLLLIAADRRGHGLGHLFVDHIVDVARARHAPRLFIAVLEANPKARAFWTREGFAQVLTLPPTQMGQRLHIRHRMERRL